MAHLQRVNYGRWRRMPRHGRSMRMFEVGFTIEQVALVTGHKDWKMLPRYTRLKPEALHTIRAASAA